jgi:hypothetical protein
MANSKFDMEPALIEEARSAVGRWVQVRLESEGKRGHLLEGVCLEAQGECDQWGRVRIDLRTDFPGLGRFIWCDLDAGWALWDIGSEAPACLVSVYGLGWIPGCGC